MGDVTASFRLDGRLAVVTGASRGLGAAVCAELAHAGATILATARGEKDLRDVVAALPGEGHIAVAADLQDSAQVARIVEAAKTSALPLRVLVNNAGYFRPQPFADESDTDFDLTVDVNLRSVFVLCRELSPLLTANGGSIVNIASVMGHVGVGKIPGASYAAAKAGVVGLTRELAAQWARTGVRVNALLPGWFVTEMTEQMFRTERGTAWVNRSVPMGRPGIATEIAGSVLFLASDASSYVTGAAIPVDGGWTAV